MGAPVLHIQLVKKGEEHVLENGVSLGAHENLSLVDVLGIYIFIDWQVCTVLFKQALLPDYEGDEHEDARENKEANEVLQSVILLIVCVGKQVGKRESAIG